jgi:translocation and assembly module TamB
MSRRAKILWRVVATMVVLLIVAAIGGLMALRSDWLREKVRAGIVKEIETATGGRAEIGSFTFDWSGLVATVEPLTLHGTERADEPPLLRVQSIHVGLRVISLMKRQVDLSFLRLKGVAGRVVIYPDGTTNVPTPKSPSNGNPWAQELLNLAIKEYEISDGVFEVDDRKVPINLRGRDLRVRMTYDSAGPRYRGELSSAKTHIEGIGAAVPIEADASLAFTLERSRIEIAKLHVTTAESQVDLTGVLDDTLAPRGTLKLKASGSLHEVARWFKVRGGLAGTGTVDGNLELTTSPIFDIVITGRFHGEKVAYAQDRLHLAGAEARGDLRMTQDHLSVTSLEASAMGGRVRGQVTIDHWRDFAARGQVEGLSVRQVAEVLTDRVIPWNGSIAGTFAASAIFGRNAAKISADVGIARAQEGTPVEGQVDGEYDQASGTVKLGESWLAAGATRVDVKGTLGQTLEVQAQTTNLDDILPALAMLSASAPKELPVKLVNGSAGANGAVTGPLDSPKFAGTAIVSNAVVDGHSIQSFSGQVNASQQSIRVGPFTAARGATQVQGSVELDARNGSFEDAGVNGRVTVRAADLAALAKEFGAAVDIAGTAGGTAQLGGTIQKPDVQMNAQVEKPSAYGEQIDRLTANVHYSPTAIEAMNGQASAGAGRVQFRGGFRHAENDYKNGNLQFSLEAQSVLLTQVTTIAKQRPEANARFAGKLSGTAHIANGEIAIENAQGDLTADAITWNQRAVGSAAATIETRGDDLTVQGSAKVRDVTLKLAGGWKLTGDQPGTATVELPRMTLATINDLRNILAAADTTVKDQGELPFEGYVQGGAKLNVALRKLEDLKAEFTLDKVQVNARANQALKLGVQPQDVVLTNTAPVVLDVTTKEARVRSAKFTGRDTNIEATGSIGLDEKSSADLTVRGSMNLIVLQLLNPSLLARGNASVQAQVRGSIVDPQVNGRLGLENASLYFADLPNGVDKANGVVLFDRNRATIERLAAETGGGVVRFSGFLEFGSTLVYRLQADAQQVRVRYPEDVSTTFNALLNLNGTSDNSTLSGSITVTRASFTPRADIGQLLASTSTPAATAAAPNEYLRGMQLDVRIETGANFQFETSLTRDVQAEADLRLRGSPFRPLLLGTVSINQGEVTVFGNRYTVNRGEIRFLNPVKLEPSFDMDLETKARGIVVTITFSGTMDKLNVNYSSDPPLQSREIIALLAVGRDPNTSAGLASSQVTGGGFVEAGSGLLGQAVAAQLSSRVQRFFGASRVKIDPQLGGVENLPQARLTLEQQVSKDITLTYITNLNRTQEQVVRLQWDFSKEWSAVAVREGNGLFGVDFQYRKRFK